MALWDRWRATPARAGGAPAMRQDSAEEILDGSSRRERSPAASPLGDLLDQIEATALRIYAAHGLPDRKGHYARHPRTGAWAFVTENLTPQERFALMEANPPEDGWRFGRLQDIGLQSGNGLLRVAASVLDRVATMRTCEGAGMTEDDLLSAIRLGEAWREIREGQAPEPSPLVLTAPEDSAADASPQSP